MMTLKIWNTLDKSTRKEIINLCGFNAIDALLEPYHHNFDYDIVGKRLKKILECCYFRPSDKQIVVSIEVTPKYAPKETKKPVVKATAPKIVTITAQEAVRKIDAGYITAVSALPQILNAFGDKKNMCQMYVTGDFKWNHRIEGFYLGKSGKVFVDIYWQGDSTDGSDGFCLTDKPNGYRIPAVHYDDGSRTRTIHSDIRIDKDEIYNAIKLLKEQIQPAMKKVEKKEPTCCVCGKPLTREDIHYYDLTDYCIDCAIADGIRTSKD